jgi:hypothetical protein
MEAEHQLVVVNVVHLIEVVITTVAVLDGVLVQMRTTRVQNKLLDWVPNPSRVLETGLKH